MKIFIGLVIGLFVGTFGGFLLCALAVVASRDDRRRERDAELYMQQHQKKEDTHDDREPVSEVGFKDF